MIKYITIACLLLAISGYSDEENSAYRTVEKVINQAGIQFNGTNPWDMQIHNKAFAEMVLANGSLGLGESYMSVYWDCEKLDEFFYRALRARLDANFRVFSWQIMWQVLKAKLFNLQDKNGSLKVIEQHYQLGNDLFQNMLDSTMAYSCGYWKSAKSLTEAQIAKYDLIARKLGIKPGMKVLDIGCGWGGFAKYIAENYGADVVGITLSQNQAEYARNICKGLNVDIRVQDYRDVHEIFDRVVEIGMFEHVGEKNYREFMQIAYNCLNENGILMLHTIGANISSNRVDPWIERYIFPRGQLPSIAQIGSSIEGLFIMEDWHNFGADYDKTLMAWYQNFKANWPNIEASYSPTFYRMWTYYLLSCAGAFRARDIELWQVVLSKNGIFGGYTTVR
jgi:cyclopropane-fatty-acyl-phospholipid synthase